MLSPGEVLGCRGKKREEIMEERNQMGKKNGSGTKHGCTSRGGVLPSNETNTRRLDHS